MGAGAADLLDAADGNFEAVNHEGSGVARLAAHFGVKDRLVGNDEPRVFLRMDFKDGGLHLIGLKANKLGAGIGGDVQCSHDGGFLCGTRAFALLLHELFKTRHVHRDASLGTQQFR
jgi:hypothetical protein